MQRVMEKMNGTMAHKQKMDLNLANKPSDQSNTRYMSVKSAAEYLNTSSRTIYRLIHKRLIPNSRSPLGYRFDKEEIDKWMKAHHVPEAELPEIKEF